MGINFRYSRQTGGSYCGAIADFSKAEQPITKINYNTGKCK